MFYWAQNTLCRIAYQKACSGDWKWIYRTKRMTDGMRVIGW